MKIRMITRTITSTLVSVACFDFSEREKGMHYVTRELSGDFNKVPENERLNAIRESMETDTFKVLSVEVKETVKRKYAISENDFIKYGHIATDEDKDNEDE